MLGQEVLFCLGRGRQEWLGPGAGRPGCLRAPSSPAGRSPALQTPLLNLQLRAHVEGRRDGTSSAAPGLGPQAPGQIPHLGFSWGPPAGGVGAGGPWAGKTTARRVPGLTWLARPPGAPPARRVQKRDADCENRREGVGSFPSLIIDPPLACSLLLSHPIPAAGQPRTRFQVRF